ncbi:hypothetical protein GCM10012285_23770 [Streptomyces kronopolitis]|uniref:NACHT domain-containing protein n=1 Tax=Streptomyces kronopolitis TaxID=1612435 RepID=A0ABQ2JAF9_9ACTN|nr:hypothetical protein GCM10012285_23770 [Streptomyces kronopolitis]
MEWQHSGIDIAVLRIPDDADTGIDPVSFGRVGEQDAVLCCTALGFPRFKLRADENGSCFRDAEHIHATCAILSNRREGTLDLGVTPPPAAVADSDTDAWEGMSGAAVFSNGHLIGVVTRHYRADGPGRIAATRVDRWVEKLTATELAALEQTLRCRLHPEALHDAVPDTGLGLLQDAYRAQLADIAPEKLEDREALLRDLVAFCGGPGEYLWLQGPPWAGKTAVAAWFALQAPRGVVPVWFFVTARYASQSDSEAYTGAFIDQLAAVVGREPTSRSSPLARDGERRLLLREAAERVAHNGGTLLLIVDGLDEDQSLLPSGNGTSIASLLPERLPSNVRVLVTSRTSPDLPADVKGDHPLRHCPVVKLSATEAAKHTEFEAKFDLYQALSGDQLQRDLVGLLAAARGTLTVDDLQELTGEQSYELRQRLGSAFGRILRMRGGFEDSGGDASLYLASRGYLFAHETLLATAQNELGPDIGAYSEQLHVWAATYKLRGWPASTPAYLLQPYGRLLALLRDTCRSTNLATDAQRRDRLREVTGSDAACLSEIASARQIVQRATPDDLGALAALAAVADLVARRNELLHPDIPAVYARLGRTRHAIGLARSVFRPMDRAQALAGVSRALAEAGDPRAVGLARESLQLTDTALSEDRGIYDDSYALVALGRLATVLAATGRESDAVSLLSELPSQDYDLGIEVIVEAFVATAAAVRDPVRAADLLHQAEESAQKISFLPDRIRTLASIAEARVAGPGSTGRLYDAVTTLAQQYADGPTNVPAAAAEVLHQIRPHDATRMVRLAVAHAGEVLREPQSPTNWGKADGAVRALAATGQMDDAQLLMEALREAVPSEMQGPWNRAWLAIAVGWAREGQVAEAWAALEASWEAEDHHDERDRSAAYVASLLAAAGAAEQLETLLLNTPNSWQWVVAEAFAALALHFCADDPDQSLRLLHQAEHGRHSADGSVFQNERLAVFAGALATAGWPDQAERLIEAISQPDVRVWGCAVVSVAVAHHDSRRALDLAERAVDAAPAIDHWPTLVNTLTVAVQALAYAGAVDRAAEVIEQLSGKVQDRESSWRYLDCARTEAAAGIWLHAPERAGQLADSLLQEMHRSVLGFARLLVAVGPYDQVRSARVRKMLRSMETAAFANHGYDDLALLGLLTGTTDPDGARRRIDQVMSDYRRVWPYSQPGTMMAVAYAALGDFETACAIAQRIRDETERSETLADLAAYVACVPGDPTATPLFGDHGFSRSTLRRLVALLFPPASGPNLPHARVLLADALTPEGWHHATPVLASVDAAAFLRVRDVVFAHLGLP